MSKHTSTRRESRNGVSMERAARLPSGSLPLRKTWPISLCIGLAIGSITVSTDALAGGPTGGAVVGGSGSITQSGNETVINQLSQRLALNWETFNLKANESVLFNQPGRSAVALNRILDQNPSQIFGKINSNGQVFLINTHGIIFGATAQMNVGGLMASTLDLTPKDFLAGNYNLNAVGGSAGIVNHGLIQAASGGSVALIGGSVLNDGLILANYGSISLDGADHAVLDFDGNGLINIQITGELKQRLDAKEAAVSNKGTLQAEGGTVVLQASAAKDLFTNLVNNSGVIDASGISTDGGAVRLVGSGGNVGNSGSIDASGVHGGSVQLLSDRDVMVTGGTLDASGRQGGGAIRVGGGARGGEGLAVADRTYVAANAVLNADATSHGNGGSIAVFSRDNSVVAGSLSARGGVSGGNGGFVETSSHGALTVTGTPQAMARATGGLGGNWLIDPNNITIVAGGGNTKINAASPFVSTDDGASLGVDLITAALTGGANVTITTGTGGADAEPGDITLNADLDYDGKGTNALTLDAAHDIVINNLIFDSTPGGDVLNLSLLAGNSISLNSDISLGGGAATLTATAGSISQAAGKLLSGGALTLNAATGIGTSSALETKVDTLAFANSGTGGVALNDADALTVSGSTASGVVNISARTGDLTIGGDVSSADDVSLGAGAGNVVHSSGTVSGDAVHFNAWGANGSIGASDAVLTNASQISFEAKGTGTVQIVEANGAAVSGTAVSGDVAITSTTGDLIINGNINTAGNVNLNALAGSISRTAGTIAGNALTLTAGGTDGAIGASDAIRTDAGSIVFGANGTGTVNITEASGASVSGTAGSGDVGITSAAGDLGVVGTGIATKGGAVTLNAVGGGARINIGAGATVDTTNGVPAGANVSLVADNADISGTINAGTAGIVAIRQATAGRMISLGSDAPTQLGVTNAEFDLITANTIVIGDANSGDLRVFAAIAPTLSSKLSLNSGGTITQAAGAIITTGTLSGSSVGATTLGEANQIGNLGTFTASSFRLANASSLTLTGDVSTTGAQVYDAAVMLGADRVLSGTDITFNSTVDGNHSLTVNGSGITTFTGAVGDTNALTSLTTGAGGSTTLGGYVTTSGAQTYNEAVNLSGATVLASTANGNIKLGSTVDGAQSLTVNTGGTTTFAAVVGSTGPLASLTTDAVGGTTLNGNVSTTGAQTYGDVVTLGGDVTLASSGIGTIKLAGAVNGAHNLTVSTGGLASFGGAVGGGTALSRLTVNSGTFSANALNVGGNLSVTTSGGDIGQGGAFIVSGTSGFDAGTHAINLGNAGNQFTGAVSLAGSNAAVVNSLATVLGSGTTSGTLAVSSNGALTQANGTALDVTGLATFTQNNTTIGASQNITLDQNNNLQGGTTFAVGAGAAINDLMLTNGATTPSALVLPATIAGDLTLGYSNASLSFPVAGVTIGGNLDATAGSGITLTDNVTTTGSQSYHSAVTLGKTLTLAGSNIDLASGVTGAGYGLTITGNAVLGTASGLNSLQVTGSSSLNGNVTTGGAQTYAGATILLGDSVLTSMGTGTIGFGAALDGAHNLTVSTGGLASFGAAVGSGTALSKLSVSTSAGDITQNGAFTVTGVSSFDAGTHAIILSNAGNNFSGAVSLNNSGNQAVTLNNGTHALSLAASSVGSGLTTIGAGDIVFNGAFNAVGGQLDLASAGTISEGAAGLITAGTLSGNSAGSTSLLRANQVNTLGAFTTGGDFAFNNAQSLTVNNAPSANGGAGNLTLTTTGASSDLILASNLTGNTVTLGAGRNINQTGGVITATTLTGSSTGSTTLNFLNQVGTLSNFTAATFALTSNAPMLTVAGTVDGGASTALTTTAGNLAINGAVKGTTTTLKSAGTISEGAAGLITAGTLSGNSTGSTSLLRANQVNTLGVFTTGGDFAFNNAQSLTVNNAPSANGGAGNLTLTTTGASSDLILASILSGNTVTLGAGRHINQTGGGINATTLTGSSTGSTTLNAANHVDALGAFTTGGDFSFNNAQSLTVSNAPSANGGAGNLTLTTTGVSSDLILASNLTGNTVTLGAGHNINQTSGVITATTLTGSSTGSTTLNFLNQVGTLSNFTAATFALTSNAPMLTVTGTVDGGASTALTTTAGNLAINGAVKGTTTTLKSAGTISEGAAGLIAAGTLSGNSTGSTSLLRANQVNTLGAFTTGGDFAFNNAQSLTVNNAPSANGGAGNLTLTTTGASSDLILASTLSGNTVTLGAGRNINQTAGAIHATMLTGSSTGSTTLNGANHIGTLGNFTATNFALSNAQSLAVTGAVDGGASTVLTTTAGNLAINGAMKGTTTTLTSAGAISEGTGGSITAATLTGQSAGATTLNGANHIGTLGSFTAANFALSNAQALTVTGAVDGGASTSLTTTAGNLAINGAVKGGTTSLKSAGTISEGAGGLITAGTLTSDSAGSTSLLRANQVNTLGAFTTGGDFAFNNAQSLTVNSALSANGGAGNLTLTTTGASSDLILASTLSGNTVTLGAGRHINQTGGGINATTLTGSSTGSTTLNGANHIGTLGNFTATNFALSNAQSLAVTGAVDGGASTALTTTAGNLAINGAVKGTTTTLTSAGAISEGANGSITANLLTGRSVGNTTLDGNNHIDTLGSFSADFSLTNGQTLTVVGPLDGGHAVALTTTAGDLIINGAVSGTTTTLTSAGAISEGAGGSITAATLTGQSAGATTLNGTNHVGTLGSFRAANFALTNAQALTVAGPLDGGASTVLTTTAGDLLIQGAVSGAATTLNSAGAITEGTGGVITAGTLSGTATGPTTLGSVSTPNKNMVDTLGNFTSLAGFSMTNDKTLTLASVAGSSFTVNAGTSAFYLSVTHGDLFQLGTAPVYDSVGIWGSTGRMGTSSSPIYVVGTGGQSIANVGLPPAYFYAVDSSGNLLPLVGGFAINVPTISGAGNAQNGNHGDSYIDPSVITANYRSYGIVPSGVRLPPDQQSGCDPDQPDQAACQDPDSLGMVLTWPKAPQ